MAREAEDAPLLNSDAEEALLGAILVSPQVLGGETVGEVRPRHFSVVRHRWTFSAMHHLAAEDRSIDLVTVGDELDRQGHLQEVGGLGYLTQLANRVPSATHADEYAHLVLRHAESESLKEAADGLLKLAYNPNGTGRWGEAQAILDRHISETPDPGVGPIDYAELQAMIWPDEAELVPGLIPTAGIASISGVTGGGKTFIALDIHMAVAEAGKCLGNRQVRRGGPTLYLGIDNGTRTLQRRTRNLAMARGMHPNVEGFHLYQDPLDLSSDQGAAKLKRMIMDLSIVLVSVDMLSRYVGKADLNQMHEVGPMLMRLRRIADETGASILLLHRLNKQGISLGSVDIEGSVDSAMALTMKNVAGTPIRTLKHTKHRDLETSRPMHFSIQLGEQGGISLVWAEAEDAPEQIDAVETTGAALYEVLKEHSGEWLTRNELQEALGKDAPGERQFKDACTALPRLKGVEVTQQGRAYAYCFKGE